MALAHGPPALEQRMLGRAHFLPECNGWWKQKQTAQRQIKVSSRCSSVD